MRGMTAHRIACAVALALAAPSAVVVAAGAPAAAAPLSGSVTWTQVSPGTKLGIASAGLLRTSDGRLHVVWSSLDGAGSYSLHYTTLGAKAKKLNTGTIVSKWTGVSFYPRLVAGPSGGLRLVFTGGNGHSGSRFDLNAIYSAVSGKAGQTWTLAPGSLSQSELVPLTDTAAAVQANGTPVAGWSAGAAFDYHLGIDPNTPAAAPDKSIGVGASGDVVGPGMARESDGSIWAAWFNASGASSQGYYVARILPSVTAKVKAPDSGGKTVANNQPLESVAFTARSGGGGYLAYCVPTKTVECAHVALWKVGSAKTLTVPGSSTGHASHVAIAAGPGGKLWVLWYDSGLNKIRVVATNAAATSFGTVSTINGPSGIAEFDGLQAEGSQGPLDVIALVAQSKPGTPTGYWAAELAS